MLKARSPLRVASASSTRMPDEMTSGPMPSAGMAAIEWVRMMMLRCGMSGVGSQLANALSFGAANLADGTRAVPPKCGLPDMLEELPFDAADIRNLDHRARMRLGVKIGKAPLRP